MDLKFYSTTELYDAVKAKPFTKAQPDYFNPYSWDETMDHFKNGWSDSESIKINAENINASQESNSYSTQYDVTGDFLDIGTFLSGVPECWGQMIETPKPRKELSILIDIGLAGANNENVIKNRGSAILAMIEELRSKGFFINITINSSARLTKNKGPFNVQLILDTENGYSKDQLAFCVAHPGFFRRIIFGLRQMKRGVNDGYSTSGDPTGYDIHIKSVNDDKMNWSSIEESKHNIERILKLWK